MTRFLFIPGFFLGLALGIVLSLYIRTGTAIFTRLATPPPPTPLVQCASIVDTKGWEAYRNLTFGFEIKYPAGFEIGERGDNGIVLTRKDATRPLSIVFEKFRGPLTDQLMPEMHQGGWKIADRQVYALTTSYYTNDDQSLSAIYLFVRDFPLHMDTGEYSMIRATITTEKEAFDTAKDAKLVDPESLLTEPEQILSTFRFLQYNELPGRDSGAARPF